MSSKADRRSSPSRSQLIVTDPAAFLQELKQRLALKEGIPETQQRLIFSVPQASEEAEGEQPPTRAAEDVLGELGSWQAILFQNGRAIGRLLAPQLSSTQTREEGWSWLANNSDWANSGVVVEVVSLVYKQWQPVWLKDKDVFKHLYIPVDKDFSSSKYTLQVIGRSGGRPFIVPFAYQFSGQEVAIALGLEAQRADYIQRHQLRRGRAASTTHRQNLAVECGKGLKGITAIFDAEDRPAWLKSVALRFAVVASRSFDDSSPSKGDHTMPENSVKADDKPSLPVHKSPAAEQAAKESWLPKMPTPGPPSKKSKPKAKAKSQERSKPTAPLSQDISAQPGNEPEPVQSSEVSQPQATLPGKTDTLVSTAPSAGLQKPLLQREEEDTMAPLSKAESANFSASQQAAYQPRAGMQASRLSAEGAPAVQCQAAGIPKQHSGEKQQAPQGLLGSKVEPAAPRPEALNQVPAAQLMTGGPSEGGESSRGRGITPVSAAVPRVPQVSSAGPVERVHSSQAVHSGGKHADASQRRAQSTVQVDQRPFTSHALTHPARSAAFEADAEYRHQESSQTDSSESSRQEETLSDDSMVTASSGPDTPSPNIDAQSAGACLPHRRRSGSPGSSEGSGFPAFGSLGSEASPEEGQTGKGPAPASTLPGFEVPNGAVTSQMMPGLGGSRDASWANQGGSNQGLPAVLQQWHAARLSPSASASNLPASIDQRYANGSRQDLMSLLSLGNIEEGTRGQASSSSAVNQRIGSQPGFSRPYDPLTLCSPISTHDGSHSWPAAESAGWGQPIQMPVFVNQSRGLPEGSKEAVVAGSSTQLSNGLPYMIFPMEMSTQLPFVDHGFSTTAPNGPARLQPRGSSESTSVSETGLQAVELAGASGPLSRSLEGRVPGSREASSGPTLPAHLFSQHVQATESQKVPAFPSPPQSSRPDLSGPLANGGFFGPPTERPALRTATGPLEGHVPPFEELPFTPAIRHMPVQRYNTGGRARSHDSAVDPSARALLAEARHGQAADIGMHRIMTPPPPPPPRTPPPPRADLEEFTHLSLERQSSFQVPRPPNHGAFDRHGLPSNDIERLMSCVTPVVERNGEPVHGQEAAALLRLADVWRFFEEASVYGREVYTRSGQRGAALAYYTPTLSAIRVLLPCDRSQSNDSLAHAQPLLQHFESELPFNREPFTEALASLAADRLSDASRWQNLRLSELHPESWFAVAWYPIYRIPDAPLTAKFLTFHSLRPVPACYTYFGAMDPLGRPAVTAAEAESSPLCVPILGLKCAEQKGEQWFENYNRSPAARSEWEKRHQQLQARAISLSAGKHLRLLGKNGEWEQPQQSHGDLEWFIRHP